MIFRSAVSVMVVVAIASAAVITVPNISTTKAPNREYNTMDYEDFNQVNVTMKLSSNGSTKKPANKITTVKQADNITTVKSVDKITATKSAAPVPTPAPMISCYCNLPECLTGAGGDGICSTRLGCYSEVHPLIPEIGSDLSSSTMTPTVTESNKTANGSSASPIISELDEFVKSATTEHVSIVRGSFGCLDQLNFAKQSCDEILKSMEAESSEFPTLQVPTNGAAPSANNFGVHAFHCCQTERCNGNQSGPAEGSVKSAQAVLVAAFKNAVPPPTVLHNSTVGVPWTPTVESSVNKVEPSNTSSSIDNVEPHNTKSSVNNVELSNAKKIHTASSELWHGHFASLGEPKAPSPLQSDNIFEDASLVDATTLAIPAVKPPTLSVAIPVIQEINHDETVANVEHVVTKRHDGQKAVPVLKQTIDDQENIADFDDDIAAEVSAVVAITKSPETTTQKDTVSSKSPISFEDSWAPRHSGVPDFIPPPSLKKKKNITTNSISATRGENNNSNSYNNHADNKHTDNIHADNNHADNGDSNKYVVVVICTAVALCLIGLTVLKIFVVRTIIRKYDVFRNYKSVCSNPGKPCACTGGFTRGRPRTQPSSSHPHAPLLPPPNPGQKYRGHSNAGATYNDSFGDTTYAMTPIPAVSNHLALVRVVRR